MNDYVELNVRLNPCNEIMTDILASLLADEGYESFVPDDNGLLAYIKSADYKPNLDNVFENFPFDASISTSEKRIEGRDWNKEWEQNYFKPIIVGDRCVIHSTFHTDIPECEYDIVIDPKMAFGTGHHATTSLMIDRLLDIDIVGQNVTDMGTGTGILAILAAMRGAAHVTGIEIDEMAFENAVENTRTNNHHEIELLLGDARRLAEAVPANLFIANINRNIITADIPSYVKSMAPGARVLFSGFYIEDIPVIREAGEANGLEYVNHTERNRWCCVEMHKKP